MNVTIMSELDQLVDLGLSRRALRAALSLFLVVFVWTIWQDGIPIGQMVVTALAVPPVWRWSSAYFAVRRWRSA